jgi:methenyltetrahydromethanopterin cyclohydrolase
MTRLSFTARNMFHAVVATVSGLFIASAVVFGALALAVAGLLIGIAGALSARVRTHTQRPAVVTLTARKTGRGWSVDPYER